MILEDLRILLLEGALFLSNEEALRVYSKNLTNEEFEEEFRDELMTLIEDRPYKEINKVKFMKKSGVKP